MPRGDGKKPGEPRPDRKKTKVEGREHPGLEARIKAWQLVKNSVDAKNRDDGEGNIFRKPGSQKR